MKPPARFVLLGLALCVSGCFDPQPAGDDSGSTGTSSDAPTSSGTPSTTASTTEPPPPDTSSSTDPATSTGQDESTTQMPPGTTTEGSTTTGAGPLDLCDLSGDPLSTCDADFGDVVATGMLGCDGVEDTQVYYADIYELDLAAKDCLSVFADNIGPAGPTGSPGPDLIIQIRAEDGSLLQLDDEMPCTDPVWTGDFACPRGGFSVAEPGTYIIAVTQYGGPGCPNGGPYSLHATVNGKTLGTIEPTTDDLEVDCS